MLQGAFLKAEKAVVGQHDFHSLALASLPVASWLPGGQDKAASEQLRREAETLRQTAIKLMEHAAVLIEKSAQLEHQVSLLKRGNPKQGRKS
jgi:hypothetical protein